MMLPTIHTNGAGRRASEARRRPARSGAVSGAIPGRCRRGSSVGTERCAAGSPSRPGETKRIGSCRDALSALFEQEPNPIEVIKWKEIYENFEEGTDRCEDASNILERIALKQPLMSHQNFRPTVLRVSYRFLDNGSCSCGGA
jgi:hypothetical protein